MIDTQSFFPGKVVFFERSRFGSNNDIPNLSNITLLTRKKINSLNLYTYKVAGYKENVIQDEIYENESDWKIQKQIKVEKETKKYIAIPAYI